MISQSKVAGGSRTTHYAGLDGLRGVAALFVVLYHVLLPLNFQGDPHGYLAVDFFFMLSGFVVANAYLARLSATMSFSEFAKIRLVRLYPLFLLGMTMGIVVSMGKAITTHSFSVGIFLQPTIMAFLILPFGSYSHSKMDFPFNGPAWSLFYEFVINFVFAASVRFLTNLVLSIVVCTGAVVLAIQVCIYGSAFHGASLSAYDLALARVTFSFFAGVGLHRLFTNHVIRRVRYGYLAAAFLLTLILMAPDWLGGRIFDPLAIMIGFPLVMLLSFCDEPAGFIRSWSLKAGALSYPIYITHAPVSRIFQTFAENHHLKGLSLALMVVIEVLSVLVVGWIACDLFDAPLQSRLKKWMRPDRPGTSYGESLRSMKSLGGVVSSLPEASPTVRPS
jgi:peptidoglycan/LPS O-acetylase OafA/YrhL